MKTETILMRQIRSWLTFRGWYVIRFQQGLGSHRGLADLCAIKDEKTLWIEVKAPKGKLSAHQEKFRDEVVSHGGMYHVVRSVDEILLW